MDNQNVALMVEHHQYMETEALKRENLLAVEIQQSYCETLCIKKYTLFQRQCLIPLLTNWDLKFCGLKYLQRLV